MQRPPSLLHNLLDDPLLGVEDDLGRRERVTLPGLLARLSRAEPTALTAVQAHQQHAVHAFLVQLAAIALARAGTGQPARDEDAWRDLLLGAAKEDGAGVEAFALVVGDLAKPALLQPPVPEGKLDVLRSEHVRPSAELDVLITSKNHDVKIDRVAQPGVEHWIYALVTLQTMQGFLGAGNYGIARMNGGFASRPCVAFAPDHGAAPRFLRDVGALLDAREALSEAFGLGTKGHLGLVWCAPWNGETSLAFSALDPFFVEICRRIRLAAAPDGTLVAHRGSSKAARIDARESSGNTGDPWTPVARKDGKALTMSEAGFTYERVRDLLFGDYRQGAAGDMRPGAGDRMWVGQVLVRGQGKTGGYHERWVPVPAKVRSIFAKSDDRERLGRRAQGWIDWAKMARLNILKPALLTLLQGGPDKLKFDDDRADAYLRQLDAAIDEVFFPLLFEHADARAEEADALYQKRLVALAEAQLETARESLPVPAARRWRAGAQADRAFWGAARRLFKLAFPTDAAASSEAAPEPGDAP